GGMARSVRAQTGSWLAERPKAPGNYSAFIEFESGLPVTVAYDGYGYFYTSELTWGLGSRLYSDEQAVQVRRQLRAGEFDVEAEKEAMRFQGEPSGRRRRPEHYLWRVRRELRTGRHPPISKGLAHLRR